MIEGWIIFFTIGNLLGYVTDWGYRYLYLISYIVLVLIFLLFIKAPIKIKTKKSLIWVCALLWGISNNVPIVNTNIKNAKIVEYKGFISYNQKLIISNKNKFYQIKGTVNTDNQIDIKCKDVLLLITNKICYIKKHQFIKNSSNTLINALLSTIRQHIQNRIQTYPPKLQGWLYAIIFGDKSKLSVNFKNIFKHSGAYHILVVSGLHISIIAYFIYYLIKLIPHALYIIKILKPTTWIRLHLIIKIISIICTLIYCALTGFNPPAQRAFIIFTINQLSVLTFNKLPLYNKILIAISIQTLLFPSMFICESTLMSWLAYIFIVHLGIMYNSKNITVYVKILQLFYTQFKMLLLVMITLGTFTPLGFITNIIFVPLFPSILISAVILILIPQNFSVIINTIIHIQSLYMDLFIYITTTAGKIISFEKIQQMCCTPILRAIVLIIFIYVIWFHIKFLKNNYSHPSQSF